MRIVFKTTCCLVAGVGMVLGAMAGEDLTAASYSREGLIAQWDGIENAGLGLPHDSAANVWKDLAGARDLTLVSGKGEFVDNALNCLPRPGGYVTGTAEACTGYKTIEVVCDRFAGDYGFVFNSGAESHFFAFTQRRIQGSEISMVNTCCATTTNRATWAFTYSDAAGNATAGHENGKTVAFSGTERGWQSGGNALALGASAGQQEKFLYSGRIYAIRLYDRVLTSDELARHSTIDAVRFFGAPVPCSRVSVTVKGAGVVSVDGTDRDAPIVIDVPLASTISLKAKADDGNVFLGWSGSGADFHGDMIPNPELETVVTKDLELTVYFVPSSEKPKYGVTDYSYDGLVAFWDGLSNAGIGEPHDSTTNVWKDLTGKRDLTLASGKGEFVDNALNCLSRGNGYVTDTAEACTDYRTIEVVCDRFAGDYGFVFNSGAKSHIFAFTKQRTQGSEISGENVCCATTTNRATWAFTYSGSTGNATAGYENGKTVVFDGKEGWSSGGNVLALGASSGHLDQYLYSGRIYAIRLYDRVLTSDELARHSAIDAVRFFGAPAPHSRVSVTIKGEGVVSVDGTDHGESFAIEVDAMQRSLISLQARANDGSVFLCWSGSGADFRGDMIPKPTLETVVTRDLELTVHFVPSSEKPKYGVTDYSYDGLVAFWDGLSNAGIGEPHDSTANVWKDLAGKRDLTLVSGKGEFVDNALNCLPRPGGYVTGTAEACTDYRTIEVVCDRCAGDYGFVFNSGAESHFFAFTQQRIQGSEASGCCATTTNRATWAFTYSDVGGNATAGHENGKKAAFNGSEQGWKSGGNVLALGASAGQQENFLYSGKIYAIRLYDRMLTREELRRHALLDQVRYFGAAEPRMPDFMLDPDGSLLYRITAGAAGGRVRVNGGTPVVGGTWWLAVGSTVTFEAMPNGGRMLAGWSEPVLDAAYVTADTVREMSFSATVTECATLSASCEKCSRLQKVGAADYVRPGLVAQWDGIENAGLGLPHDSTTNVWKDLAGNRDLPLVEGRGSFGENSLVCTKVENGTYAAGPAACISAPGTVEVVCEAYDAAWSTVVHLDGSLSQIMALASGMRFMYGNDVIWSYRRSPTTLSWVRGASFADGCMAVSTQKSGLWTETTPVLTVGGTELGYPYCGRIYSIRVYDRALSETERLHNYLVDSIRFYGLAVPSPPGLMFFVR